MNDITKPTDVSAERWNLMRDIGVLQAKLIIDGLRDFALVPLSLVAGLISLLWNPGGKPGDHFYQLLGLGKQSETWINLFGALKNAPASVKPPRSHAAADMDELVGRIEHFMIEEHRRGGLTAQARDRLDKALDALQRKRKASKS